jgi:PHD/YefM family antitoxin component YafN of YafNO toxin-antitoxin module
MEARYLTDDKGNRVGVLLDIEEYERLREIEDEMEDMAALQAVRETKIDVERGEEEVIPWEQAIREIREGKVTGD